MYYKTILITGASSGIGSAIAKAAAGVGLQVILLARRLDRLREIQAQLGVDTQSHILNCDVTDLDALRVCLNTLPDEFSRIDVLVNNAGLALGVGNAQSAEWDDWRVMIDTNCKAIAFLVNFLLPKMVERNLGHIVNLGSVAGNYPYPGGHIYAASKAFVAELTRNLKADLLGTAVRVSNIEPGMVGGDTEFSLVRHHGDQQAADKLRQGFQALEPIDIANIVLWILNQPPHVNLNRVEVMSITQAPGRMVYHKET